jgi:hypothetical protein
MLIIYLLHFHYSNLVFLKKKLVSQFFVRFDQSKYHFMVSKKTTSQVGRVQIDLSILTKWSN